MKNTVKNLLREHGISLASPVPLSALTVIKPYLLARHGIERGTAFMLAVPYYTTFCDHPARNISSYAVSKDYHGFFEMLFADVLPKLRLEFPENRFVGFADHSPVAEVDAAAKAGLGAVGCNGLLLTKEHSSYVFLGEIITDAPIPCEAIPPAHCSACGACRRACPVELNMTRCLSALTQKKGKLDREEQERILGSGSFWGCDICQQVCPVTEAAKRAGTLYTNIPFFTEKPLPHLEAEAVRTMPKEEFNTRAYSWRGREAILRNLALEESKYTTDSETPPRGKEQK